MKLNLKNVRLSFPSIYKKADWDGIEGKYEATFLIPKSDTKTKAALDEMIATALASANNIKVSPDKICLQDGDTKEYEGYADHWSFKAGNIHRPVLINRDRTPLVESDGVLYSGCFVNSIVDIWVQNNKYGKRVNANLYGIQFAKDGESFSAGGGLTAESFEDLDAI